MQRRDWIALGVIVAGSYWLLKAKGAGSSALALSVHYDPAAGWIDDTQSVQYDDQSGNLYDELKGGVWIGQVPAGLDGTVFSRPDVQGMITTARGTG